MSTECVIGLRSHSRPCISIVEYEQVDVDVCEVVLAEVISSKSLYFW